MKLFDVLLKMIDVQKNPSVPYDIYRYFTLLEDLNKEKNIFFNNDQKETDFDTMSFDQIAQLNPSQILGTWKSKQMKKAMKLIDEEAIEVSLKLINTIWSNDNAIKSTMTTFIVNNAYGIQLYIRDIKTMVYTIFVFLSLRGKSDDTKTKILFHLNHLIKEIIPVIDKKEAKKEPEEKKEEVLWGKDNKNGEFLIISKKGLSGARCMNKNIADIEKFLEKENIKDEYEASSQGRFKKNMCNFLRQHLKNKKRYYY